MAEIRDPNIIIEKMRTGKYNFYHVKDSDNKSFLDQQQDPNVSVEEAAGMLENILSNINGLVHVTISRKTMKQQGEGGDAGKDTLKYSIKMGSTGMPVQGGLGGNIGGSPLQLILDSMQRNMDLQVKMLEQKYEHEKQMTEINQAINGAQDPLQKWMPIIGPYIPQILAHIGISTPVQPINGMPNTASQPTTTPPIKPQQVTMTDEQKKELNQAIHKLMQLDPNFIGNLTQLASLAEEKPDVYKIAISQLNNL